MITEHQQADALALGDPRVIPNTDFGPLERRIYVELGDAFHTVVDFGPIDPDAVEKAIGVFHEWIAKHPPITLCTDIVPADEYR